MSFQLLCCSSCLFFSSSRSLLNISCIFSIRASILFPRFLIIFTIIILNSFSGTLPISSSFGLVSFSLAPSSVTYYFPSFFFLFLMSGIVFLFYWLFGLRLPTLEFVGCWVVLRLVAEDLWETSFQWILPGVWGSLLILWSGLGAPTTGASAPPPAHESRSCKLRGAAKKKKNKEYNNKVKNKIRLGN